MSARSSAINFDLDCGIGGERVVTFNLHDAGRCARDMDAAGDGQVAVDGAGAFENSAFDKDLSIKAAIDHKRSVADGGRPGVSGSGSNGQRSCAGFGQPEDPAGLANGS